jgi:hypothetical protein
MDDTRTLTETSMIRKTIADLGFRPAILDYSTMTMYWSFDGLGGPPRLTLMAGFEREGFFYTRAAAERAAGDWA